MEIVRNLNYFINYFKILNWIFKFKTYFVFASNCTINWEGDDLLYSHTIYIEKMILQRFLIFYLETSCIIFFTDFLWDWSYNWNNICIALENQISPNWAYKRASTFFDEALAKKLLYHSELKLFWGLLECKSMWLEE